jgi:invasion protein IalB
LERDPAVFGGLLGRATTLHAIRCKLMRHSYLYLSAVFFALQGQTAFGNDIGSRTLDQRPWSRAIDSRTAADENPNLRIVQSTTPPAQPAPQAGATLPAQRTETINYENWILTCREFLEGAKKRTCAATVAVQRSENGQTVFALSVQLNDQGKVTASIQTPAGVAIAPGVELKFDKTATRKAAFEFCEPSRCVASLAADTAFIRDASATSAITLSVQSSDGKPVNFEFPIKGFDKAFAKMMKG